MSSRRGSAAGAFCCGSAMLQECVREAKSSFQDNSADLVFDEDVPNDVSGIKFAQPAVLDFLACCVGLWRAVCRMRFLSLGSRQRLPKRWSD